MAKKANTASNKQEQPQAPANDCAYSVAELAQVARARFGVRPEVV